MPMILTSTSIVFRHKSDKVFPKIQNDAQSVASRVMIYRFYLREDLTILVVWRARGFALYIVFKLYSHIYNISLGKQAYFPQFFC